MQLNYYSNKQFNNLQNLSPENLQIREPALPLNDIDIYDIVKVIEDLE